MLKWGKSLVVSPFFPTFAPRKENINNGLLTTNKKSKIMKIIIYQGDNGGYGKMI